MKLRVLILILYNFRVATSARITPQAIEFQYVFAALWRAVPKPQTRNARKNAWILEATWILVEKRVSARRDPAKDQALIRRLGRAIAVSLKGDSK